MHSVSLALFLPLATLVLRDEQVFFLTKFECTQFFNFEQIDLGVYSS